MHPDDGNVSETLARIVDELVVAKIWQLELRLYLLLAATFFVSLVLQLGPALSMLLSQNSGTKTRRYYPAGACAS